MLRYFFDEQIDSPITKQLKLRGVDVLTAQEAGRAGKKIPDDEQLAYASDIGRVVVTRDTDFINLAFTRASHAGVIPLQKPLTIGETIDYLEYMAKTTEPDAVHDRLVYCEW